MTLDDVNVEDTLHIADLTPVAYRSSFTSIRWKSLYKLKYFFPHSFFIQSSRIKFLVAD